MSNLARAFAVFLLLLHSVSHAQEAAEVDVYAQLLGTLRYAETFRISMSKTCPRLPATADSKVLKLCSQVGFTPDKKIIQAAEPHVRKQVSIEEARKALGFWSSAEGTEISRKLVAQMRGESNSHFSPEETRLLEKANTSSYGVALGRFANSTEASIAIIRELAANAL
jgi:hypothetical protein